MSTFCGCSPTFQKPKPNDTCATCGGWLPVIGSSEATGVLPTGFFARLLREGPAPSLPVVGRNPTRNEETP